jgi:hypothetical protein
MVTFENFGVTDAAILIINTEWRIWYLVCGNQQQPAKYLKYQAKSLQLVDLFTLFTAAAPLPAQQRSPLTTPPWPTRILPDCMKH